MNPGIGLIFFAVLIFDVTTGSNIGSDYINQMQTMEEMSVKSVKAPNDLQNKHIREAKCLAGRNGRKWEFKTIEEITTSADLVELRSGRNYEIAHLDYSHPYLLPEAAALLDTIGARFLAEQARAGVRFGIRIHMTSVTRSKEDQKRLRKVNRNATRSVSAHSFGTTFDLSYGRFSQSKFRKYLDPLLVEAGFVNIDRRKAKLRALLTKVLSDLRKEGKLYAVRERRQGCFHITARCH